MTDLITVHGVRGYLDENGTAQLDLEDVVRGLGFTRTAASGNEVVRWERVREYLQQYNVPTSGHDIGRDGLPEFIPENIFFKLCFKAENETAKKFQDLVTDEILPTIRKTGSYSVKKPLSPLELLEAQVQVMRSLEQKQTEMGKQLSLTTEKVTMVENTLANVKDTLIQRDDNWRRWAIDTFNRAVEASGTEEYQAMRRETYRILEERARCNLSTRVRNLKDRLAAQGATKATLDSANKLAVIESDVRLKEIYTTIIKEFAVRYSV